MKKFEITYTYIPEPEEDVGCLEIEAEDDGQALDLFKERCEDDWMDIKRITCLGDEVDPNQLSFI